jgi:hypothetical protein
MFSASCMATTCYERAELVGVVDRDPDPSVVMFGGAKTFQPRGRGASEATDGGNDELDH